MLIRELQVYISAAQPYIVLTLNLCKPSIADYRVRHGNRCADYCYTGLTTLCVDNWGLTTLCVDN